MSINKILCHTFIVAFLGVSSLSGIAAEKNIRIKVSDEVYLSYRGTAEKKTPFGNGMISVIKDEHVIDKISGVFNGQSVTNATVNFIEGTVFKGDIEYKTSDADIIYVVSNGSFEVKMNGYKQPEIIPISGPVEIRRIWKDIRFVGMYLQSNSSLSSNKVILYKKTEILNKPLLGSYDRFVGTKPTITKEWTASFHPSGHVNNIEPRDDKNICYRFDYGDKGQGIYII